MGAGQAAIRAFAGPLAVLFVLSLLAKVLYGSAALTAGISDRDIDLEEFQPTGEEEHDPNA